MQKQKNPNKQTKKNTKKKRGRKSHLPPEGTEAPSNTWPAYGKATSFWSVLKRWNIIVPDY